MIRISNLRFKYPNADFQLSIPSLAVCACQTTAVVGPSGSGKTTMLALIAGIFTPDEGDIKVSDICVSAMSENKRRAWRLENVGMVFQDFELLPYLTVCDNILLPYRIGRSSPLTRAVHDRARDCIQIVGLEKHVNRPVTRLSQGERQRVAIARALLGEPALILADEPTGNLDPKNSDLILDLLFDQVSRNKSTLVMVTHDHSLLPRFDHVVSFADLLQPFVSAEGKQPS
jgi:putative ABC transport system ATP-binding protein